MATIAWALVCHRVSLDDEGRLCLLGIIDSLTAPTLPILVREMTLVARLEDAGLTAELGVQVDISTPRGQWSVPEDREGIEIVTAGHFVVATIRGLPLDAEGIYRFEVSLDQEALAAIDVPVFIAGAPSRTH